jgi:hypothetical protein
LAPQTLIFAGLVSHRLQAAMQAFWWDRDNGIARTQHAALQHYGHDTGFADQPARCIAPEHRRHQPRLELIKLRAGIAQSSDFHHSLGPQAKPCAGAKREQIKAARGHILTNVTGLERETLGGEFFEDFGMQQMQLAQIGLRWIARNAGAMLYRNASMRITFNAKPGEQFQAFNRLLAEAMRTIAGKRLDVRRSHA